MASYHPIKPNDSGMASDDELTVFDGDSDATPLRSWLNPKSHPRLGNWLQYFIAVEAVLIFILAATNLATLRASLRQQEILNAQHSTGFSETMPTIYSRDRRYMTLDSKYDHLWEEWTEDAQIMVPSELPGETDVQGAFSMFHQMHCLASMRKAIQSARAGKDPGLDYWDDGHWPHCFDYLRNSILCWADDTIEIATVIEGERLPYIDGTRTMRQCRNPGHMFERMRLDEKRVEKANKEDGLEHSHHKHSHGLGQGNQTES